MVICTVFACAVGVELAVDGAVVPQATRRPAIRRSKTPPHPRRIFIVGPLEKLFPSTYETYSSVSRKHHTAVTACSSVVTAHSQLNRRRMWPRAVHRCACSKKNQNRGCYCARPFPRMTSPLDADHLLRRYARGTICCILALQAFYL